MKNILGVEIFSEGTHNGDNFSSEDLDQIINSFSSLDFKPAIKLGHTSSPGGPAYGWVENLRRVGKKLVADFKDMPDKLYQAIKDRLYDRVSVELAIDFDRSGSKYPKVLTAVAILGEEINAVAGLKPLRDVVFSDAFKEVKSYGNTTSFDKLFESENEMNEEILEQLKAMESRLSKITAESETSKKEFANQVEALSKQLDYQVEENKKLAMEVESKKIAEKTSNCKFVAFQPHIKAIYSIALDAEKSGNVKKFSVSGKEQTIVSVIDELVASLNSYVGKYFKELSPGKGEKLEFSLAETAQERDAQAHNLAVEYQTKYSIKTFSEALKKVYKDHPELVENK